MKIAGHGLAARETAVTREALAISKDMRELYSEFKGKNIERVDADSLANIAGKNIRALAIVLTEQALQKGFISLENRVKELHEQT